MKQVDSMSVPVIISEIVAGVITGMTSVRRLFLRAILFVTVMVGTVSFVLGMLFGGNLRDRLLPAAQPHDPASIPAKDQQNKLPPREGDEAEEIQHLIRKNPL